MREAARCDIGKKGLTYTVCTLPGGPVATGAVVCLIWPLSVTHTVTTLWVGLGSSLPIVTVFVIVFPGSKTT